MTGVRLVQSSEKTIDDLQFVRLVDVQAGIALLWRETAIRVSRTFKRTHCGGAHGDHSSLCSAGFIDRLRGFGWDGESFFFRIVGAVEVIIHEG